jgi:hypothetical protein
MLPTVDEAFLASAPTRFVDTIEIALPASVVWAKLTRDGTLDWCRGLEITWLSPRPFGVGTKRQAKLLGVLLRVREEYFIWEEGRRVAFYVTAARPPAYRRSAEDYVVDALGPDRCRFTWTLASPDRSRSRRERQQLTRSASSMSRRRNDTAERTRIVPRHCPSGAPAPPLVPKAQLPLPPMVGTVSCSCSPGKSATVPVTSAP